MVTCRLTVIKEIFQPAGSGVNFRSDNVWRLSADDRLLCDKTGYISGNISYCAPSQLLLINFYYNSILTFKVKPSFISVPDHRQMFSSFLGYLTEDRSEIKIYLRSDKYYIHAGIKPEHSYNNGSK